MNREEALEYVKGKVKNPNIIKHMLATEVVMRALARRLDASREQYWALAGLLHDGDYCEEVPLEQQGIKISEWVKKDKNFTIPFMIQHAMAAHNHNTGVKPESKIDWALFCCDSLTGLIVAATLVLPSKKIADLTVESVLKRFKEPSFARGTRRDDILSCEKELNIPLETFVKMSLVAMQGIGDQLGL